MHAVSEVRYFRDVIEEEECEDEDEDEDKENGVEQVNISYMNVVFVREKAKVFDVDVRWEGLAKSWCQFGSLSTCALNVYV